MLNHFYSEISELKRNYLVGQDEEIDDVIKNVWSVFNDQLIFYKIYIVKHKPLFLSRTPTKLGSSSWPLSL